MLVATLNLYSAEVPLGHKDFYPSPQRPVGFRGNGNACYPGATPVTEFWDGTPAQVNRPLMTESFGRKLEHKGKTTAKVWDVTDVVAQRLVHGRVVVPHRLLRQQGLGGNLLV